MRSVLESIRCWAAQYKRYAHTGGSPVTYHKMKGLEHLCCGETQRPGTAQPGDEEAQRGSHQ